MTTTPNTKPGSKRRPGSKSASAAPTGEAASQPVITPPPVGENGNGNGGDAYALHPVLQDILDRLRGKNRAGQPVERLLVPDWNLMSVAEQTSMQYWMNTGRLMTNCVNQYAEETGVSVRDAREEVVNMLEDRGITIIDLPQWDQTMNSYTNLNACSHISLARLKAFNKGIWAIFGNDQSAEVQGLASRAQKAASAARKLRQGQAQAPQTVPPVEEEEIAY